ncbi:tryptophan-rich sensory protein [Patescibacteria group bacterium]|nr:tryptophan-rich sensory protein [Patescibacteria group bacterium]
MNYRRLIISFALPQLAGLAGSIFTGPAIATWYSFLEKPSFSPPNWLFGPVWITLYLLMGISVYLIWQRTDKGRQAKSAKESVRIFWIHLVFNALWSLMFFGLKSPAFGLVVIIILWLLIVVLMTKFWKINKYAAYLLAPYFVWVSFASVLNFFLWYLN